MSMYIGEALAGADNEIAHIDLMIGSKDGPVGTAFANALSDSKRRPYEPVGRLDTEPRGKARDGHGHQSYDQRDETGRPDVRTGSSRRCQGRC